MAVPDRTADSFAVPLCLWQRTACLSSPPFGSSTNSNGEEGVKDSLRLRLAQLNHEFWKETSRGFNPLHAQKLKQSVMEQYCSAMDSTKGVESIVAPVKVLTSNHKKEHDQWKSEMSLETLLSIPAVKAVGRDERVERLPLEILPIVVDSKPAPHSPSEGLSRPNPAPHPPLSSTSSSAQHSRPQQPPHHQFVGRVGNTASGSRFLNVPPPASGVKGNGEVKNGLIRGEEENDSDDEDGTTSSKWRGHRRRRRGKGVWDWGPRKKAKREAEDEEEDVEKEPAPNPFITARDQHVLNQQKKYGGSRVPQGGVDSTARVPQPHSTSYGCSKKSLGTRRAPGSRFVPPVRREEREGGGGREGCLDAVRSRVQCGGPSSSGTTGMLPPEMEGDERLRNIEPRMVELIMNEIMDHGAPVQWEDIAGLQFAKATIKEIVVWPMLRPDIFTGLRGPPKGILLFGPPGTGKTLIGKCIASQVNATFFSISASSLTSKWIGEGEKMVRALFAVARYHQPAVIFMDEIDSLLSQRSDSEHESSRRIKTEFLVQLDGATTCEDDKILLIGATNRPQEIDEAARRRLVKRLYIPLPDGAARKKIVSNLLRQQAYSLTPEELEELAATTDGYSGADMANLCREAAYGPIREAAETIQHIAADAMRPVQYKDFQAALHIIRPSVSQQDLELYVQWNKQFGCGKR